MDINKKNERHLILAESNNSTTSTSGGAKYVVSNNIGVVTNTYGWSHFYFLFWC